MLGLGLERSRGRNAPTAPSRVLRVARWMSQPRVSSARPRPPERSAIVPASSRRKLRRLARMDRSVEAQADASSGPQQSPARAAAIIGRPAVERIGASAVSETVHTFCRICESLCGLDVEVEDGRVLEIRPDMQHVATDGFACVKGLK